MEKSKTASGGIGFLGLLTIVFIVLKLLHVITWPWLWVLAPLWMPAALVIAIVVVLLVFIILKNNLLKG